MEWLKNINGAIDYIETHIKENVNYEQVAKLACCSLSRFQNMFLFITDVTLSEYVRRRRMALSAYELLKENPKIIDLALKYGYESPEAFTRSFKAFHGVSPSAAKKQGKYIDYPRITFQIKITGGRYIMQNINVVEGLRIFEEIYNNVNYPERIVLEKFPKPKYMYTLPRFLGGIISYIEKNMEPEKIYSELMNIMGISYTYLWFSEDIYSPAIEDLWRINNLGMAIDNSMRYYGRDYLYIEGDESPEYYEKIKKAIVVSINNGIPVLAGNVCGIHDFSVITGYDKNGDLLTGWAANMHHAKAYLENGMFIKEYSLMKTNTRFLFIKDKNSSVLTDREIIENAIETMNHTETQNNEYCIYKAGFAALYAFKNELDNQNIKFFEPENEYVLSLLLNNFSVPRDSIACFMAGLQVKYNNADMNTIVSEIQIICDEAKKINEAMDEVKNSSDITSALKCSKMSKLVEQCIEKNIALREKLIQLKNLDVDLKITVQQK